MCDLLTNIVLLLIFVIFVYYNRAHSYWKRRGVPQLNPIFPFGDVAQVIFRRQNMADKVKEIYDAMKPKGHKYAGMYFFSRKVFLALDPHLIKNILSKDFQHFHDRGIYYDEVNDPLSAHLFSLAGPKWKNLRAKLTPAYSPGKLKNMSNTIVGCGNEMVAILKEMIEMDRVIEIKDILARYTTDVIGTCAFGLDCNSMRNPNAEFREMGRRAFTQTIGDALKMIVIRSLPWLAKFFKLGVFAPSVTSFFKRAVEETIEYREKNDVKRNDFLQLLIQLKNKGKLDDENVKQQKEKCILSNGNEIALTMDEAAAQAFIFFLAGFETTSTTISFALFEMSLNVNIQAKARHEINSVYAKNNDELTYESIMELDYLETVILETMRKYPPAPVFLRKCTEDYQVPDTNVTIEAGLSVLIPAIALHRDPEYFPEPELFDPERFSEENKSNVWDYTYIPFGDGPRICIGMRFAMMQTKIALSLLLRNFQFTLSPKTRLPLEMEKKGIILTPINGIWLDFKKLD